MVFQYLKKPYKNAIPVIPAYKTVINLQVYDNQDPSRFKFSKQEVNYISFPI